MISLFDLSLNQYSDYTARARPMITGGSVVLASAFLGLSIVLLALKVSMKKMSSTDKAGAAKLLANLKTYKKILAEAAEKDQAVFDSYRKLRRKKQVLEAEVLQALELAALSPLKACKVLLDILKLTDKVEVFCVKDVYSDWKAGRSILNSSFDALTMIAEGSIESLPPDRPAKLRQNLNEVREAWIDFK